MSLKWRIKSRTNNPDHTQDLVVEFLSPAGGVQPGWSTVTLTVTDNASVEDIRAALREAIRGVIAATDLMNIIFTL